MRSFILFIEVVCLLAGEDRAKYFCLPGFQAELYISNPVISPKLSAELSFCCCRHELCLSEIPHCTCKRISSSKIQKNCVQTVIGEKIIRFIT